MILDSGKYFVIYTNQKFGFGHQIFKADEIQFFFERDVSVNNLLTCSNSSFFNAVSTPSTQD